MNLRGFANQDGFAIPTYGFIVGIFAMVAWEFWQISDGTIPQAGKCDLGN